MGSLLFIAYVAFAGSVGFVLGAAVTHYRGLSREAREYDAGVSRGMELGAQITRAVLVPPDAIIDEIELRRRLEPYIKKAPDAGREE